MSDKMLKFVNIGQQNPPKRGAQIEKRTLMKFTKSLFKKKQVSKQVGVHNAEFHFVKFIAL